MNLKFKLTLLATFIFSVALIAQNGITVRGVVVSATDNVPIPGVNVIVLNTTKGTTTDFDGNYEIKVNKGETLQFSYIGYQSQTVVVGNQTTINITLTEDLAKLEEVVVVGYGARKKSDVTGSVSSVKTEELTAFPVLDATQALQGRAAGVDVQSNNGGEPRSSNKHYN